MVSDFGFTPLGSELEIFSISSEKNASVANEIREMVSRAFEVSSSEGTYET